MYFLFIIFYCDYFLAVLDFLLYLKLLMQSKILSLNIIANRIIIHKIVRSIPETNPRGEYLNVTLCSPEGRITPVNAPSQIA